MLMLPGPLYCHHECCDIPGTAAQSQSQGSLALAGMIVAADEVVGRGSEAGHTCSSSSVQHVMLLGHISVATCSKAFHINTSDSDC